MEYINLFLLTLLIIFILLIYKINKYENFTGFTQPTITLDQTLQYSDKLSDDDIKKLKRGQRKMTKMLSEFDRICLKYNLKYWCCGGTLIGILHSNKWLPWDGDIDVCMLEDDYQRLEKVIEKELPKTMWFQSKKTDKYFKRPDKNTNHLPSKIRDLNSCYLNCQDGEQWHNGLQIDISTYKRVGAKLISNASFNDYTDYDYDFIFPLKRKEFDGIETYIPNKYKEYSINNWGCYPPKYSPIENRYPHEGKIEPDYICPHHYKLYPDLYKR